MRHRLVAAARAGDVATVAGAMVGLHATDPSTVFLSAWARVRSPSVAAVERAMYEDRTVARILGMRRTMFVVPVEAVPVVQAACTDAIAVQLRRRLVGFLEAAGLAPAGRGGKWLAKVEKKTLAALEARGEALAAELSADVAELAQKMLFGEGKKYEAWQSVGTLVLPLLAAEGRIVRGRPRGTWVSSQYRWAPMDVWLPGGLPRLGVAEAQAELVRRWLAGFGPGTAADLKWWTGLTVTAVRRALAAVQAVEVDLDGATGFVLPGDVDPVEPVAPWAALLPALDPTVMGWQARTWYLGRHGPALFDRNGNAGPTVWWDGRVVGGWGQREDGTVAWRLLEDAGAEAETAVEAAAEAVTGWLGGVKVTPRFRTPLERELRT